MRPPAPAWILAVAALVGAGCGQRDRAAGPGRGDAGTAAGDDGPADAAAGDARGPADAAVATASPPCPEPPPPPPGPGERLTLHPVDFADLPGWSDDSHAEALPALLASCTLLAELADDAPVGVDGAGGKARAWRALCMCTAMRGGVRLRFVQGVAQDRADGARAASAFRTAAETAGR